MKLVTVLCGNWIARSSHDCSPYSYNLEESLLGFIERAKW